MSIFIEKNNILKLPTLEFRESDEELVAAIEVYGEQFPFIKDPTVKGAVAMRIQAFCLELLQRQFPERKRAD